MMLSLLLANAIAVLTPSGPSCELRRIETSGASTTVGHAPGGCDGVEIAWRADGKKALLLQRTKPSSDDFGVFEIDLADGSSRALDGLPAAVEVPDLGYDGDVPVLLVLTTHVKADDGAIAWNGKRYPVDPEGEGLPALAFAWRWTGKAWTLTETAATNSGADFSQGTSALKASHSLGKARYMEILGAPVPGESLEDPKTKAALAPVTPARDGEWRQVATHAGPLFVWTESAEVAYATGLVAMTGAGGKPAAIDLDLGTPDFVRLEVRGGSLLAIAGKKARLVDLATRKIVWSSDAAAFASFWP